MDLEIDLRRDAAFERLVRLIHDPIFVSRHMRYECKTLVYVPHIRYLTQTKQILDGVVGFDDVYFQVSTVTFQAMRGQHITFVLLPPTDTLAPYQAKHVPQIVEWHGIMNRNAGPHHLHSY